MSHTSQASTGPTPQTNNSSGDPLLEHIVNENAKQDEELALTLMVGGTLMSGTLVSPKTYWEAMYGPDDSASSSGYENVVPDPIGADSPTATDRQKPAADDSADPPPRYLHLKNVVLLNAGAGSIMNSGYWRLRIDAVAAWVIGAIETDAAELP